jgi:hypothetical protein
MAASALTATITTSTVAAASSSPRTLHA